VLKSFARDLVSALMYLHSNGVVFCDLKPGNILLNEYSNVKLCDFGLSQNIIDMVQNEESDVKRTGTPYYMAPELFNENGTFSFASDIYALGVVLYELASGKTPFTQESFIELAKNICEKDVAPIPTLSSECNNLILRMLEKNPARRAKWSEITRHPWWTGISFEEYDYPEQPHFDQFLNKMGYTNREEKVTPDSYEPEASIKRSGVETGKAKGSANEEQLLRLSLNIMKNIKEEKRELLEGQAEQRDLRLDKNRTVNMGFSARPAEDGEEASKSQELMANFEGDKSKLSSKTMKSSKTVE
jgi:serine/threonine-protein kinase ULK4